MCCYSMLMEGKSLIYQWSWLKLPGGVFVVKVDMRDF